MLKTYKPYPNHKIFGVQKILEDLIEVWCEADDNACEGKLNEELKTIASASNWFRTGVNDVYEVCKNLRPDERISLKHTFTENNKIAELCANPSKRVDVNQLNDKLLKELKPFLKSFYSQLISLKDVKEKYGTKKEYYDDLVKYNKKYNHKKNAPFFCPCCGFGNLKSTRDKGYSPFDHYLPQKHYIFAVINFKNLVPLCHDCNSSYKGETDILALNKKVFYPFATIHPQIEVSISISKTVFPLIMLSSDEDDLDEISQNDIKIMLNANVEEIISWDEIFGIKKRYFDQVADSAPGWLKKVKMSYHHKNTTYNSPAEAFDYIVETDIDESLGFLKNAFLTSMKSFQSLIDAYFEVEGNHRITS